MNDGVVSFAADPQAALSLYTIKDAVSTGLQGAQSRWVAESEVIIGGSKM